MIAFAELGYSLFSGSVWSFPFWTAHAMALIMVRWRFCVICSGSLCILFYSRSLYLERLGLAGRWSGHPCAKGTCQLFLVYYFYCISWVPLVPHCSEVQVNGSKKISICLLWLLSDFQEHLWLVSVWPAGLWPLPLFSPNWGPLHLQAWCASGPTSNPDLKLEEIKEQQPEWSSVGIL